MRSESGVRIFSLASRDLDRDRVFRVGGGQRASRLSVRSSAKRRKTANDRSWEWLCENANTFSLST